MPTHALPAPTAYDLFRSAQRQFGRRRYQGAAADLEALLAHPDTVAEGAHGVHEARQLLARCYYHAARLGPAEDLARSIIADHPDDAYTMLLLGRTLQRSRRADEATCWLRRAEALGQPIA